MLVKTGSTLHDPGRVFSINEGVISNQMHTIATKKSGDEYTIRVSKRRYPEKVITAVISEDKSIDVAMERLNTVFFVVHDN